MERDLEADAPQGEEVLLLQCLGDLALYRGSHRVGEARRKPLAVLAVLAVEAPRAVNREALAALLWPESSPGRARRALSQAIYALRKECGTSLIDGATQLRLTSSVIDSDFAQFLRCLTDENYKEAAARYAGPFLDGFWFAGGREFERWSDGVRTKLALQHRNALLACAEEAVATGDAPEAAKWLSLAHDSYPEDALVAERLAMQYLVMDAAHLAAGVIDVFERRLRDELELELPDSLRSLRSQLHGRSRSAAPSVPRSLPDSDSGKQGGRDLDQETGSERELPQKIHDAGASKSVRVARRPLQSFARTSVLVVGILMAIGLVHTVRADDEPDTLGQQSVAIRKVEYLERAALIDSLNVGRVLILPASAASVAENVDSILEILDASFNRQLDETSPIARGRPFAPVVYTRAVPRSEATRLLHEREQQRLPSTTVSDVAWLLQRSGAALAVQPSLRRHAPDSFSVALTYYRDYSHTATARPGRPNIETVVKWSTGSSWRSAAKGALGRFRQFVVSMESCHVEPRVSPESSPWCWTKGKRLRVALTPDQARKVVRIRRERSTVSEGGSTVLGSLRAR